MYHYFIADIFDSNYEVWYKNSIEESTYEEAVEAALKYCLTKLI